MEKLDRVTPEGVRETAQRGARRRSAAALLGPTALVACAPTVDVLGVYFPGWLVSTIMGVASAYGLVYWLGRRSSARSLAESGVFFLSLAVGIALVVWWLFFSGF
jgi:hypothetical protein